MIFSAMEHMQRKPLCLNAAKRQDLLLLLPCGSGATFLCLFHRTLSPNASSLRFQSKVLLPFSAITTIITAKSPFVNKTKELFAFVRINDQTVMTLLTCCMAVSISYMLLTIPAFISSAMPKKFRHVPQTITVQPLSIRALR